MQDIIVEKPYRFIPPHRGDWWPTVIQKLKLYARYLRRTEGVVDHECRHVERLRASLDAGHGIMLAPNHCRTADPLVMGWLADETRTHVYAMASWHLFHQGRIMAWALRKMGAFSVNREGVDRQSINTAIEILEKAERPLIVFPEGGVSRTNDRLHALLDISLVARAGAKKRAKRMGDGKVVVHAVAIKYVFQGDLERQADKVLTEIEHRLSWRPQRKLSLIDRISKVGLALLSLKEIEYLGRVQKDSLANRLRCLIDRLLCPLEQEWLGDAQSGPVVPRVKGLRVKILPDMIEGNVDQAERERRWEQLADLYLAQQISFYPPDYLAEHPTVDRLRETIERFEEDLTDVATIHSPLKVIIEVGEAIEVSPERDRTADVDPLMAQMEQSLQGMLDKLALESPFYESRAPDRA
ncbi:MAG: 1-acyl-sn-glycerol-3-phosphate acyltransferase [Planctomycetes bacterium]|nr:1-acyl-sn-glycerol-3-phosphate acyltransferase [Planctomycetota bacterium]MBL7043973.1 1-acyl-sn-glycerol-3-phosphate acyltransferase [Pirellulaceae bacterium]